MKASIRSCLHSSASITKSKKAAAACINVALLETYQPLLAMLAESPNLNSGVQF